MPAPKHRAANACCISPDDRGKCSTREFDRVVVRIAEGQHGVVARRQLSEAGLPESAVEGRVGRLLLPVHRGVYAVGHRDRGLLTRWMAAVLACGPEAVLSHRSAAQLWAILPRSRRYPEVSRPGAFRSRGGIQVHRARVPADERAEVEGIPVTTVPRTLLDLAVDTRTRLERALHEAEALRLTDALSIPDLLRRYPRRAGCRPLRELLGGEGRDGFTQNDFEELFATLVERHGLPRPRYNPELWLNGRFVRPDCAWPERRLMVELDGRAVHGTRKAFEADRERDRVATAAGWRVVRVTWRQLNDEPGSVATDVGFALSTLSV